MRRDTVAVSLSRRFSSGAFWRMEVGVLRDDVDLRFHDRVALEEIELYAEVLSAVAAADRPLTSAEIDEVLGLRKHPGADPRAN
jgi:hypothetical protein